MQLEEFIQVARNSLALQGSSKKRHRENREYAEILGNIFLLQQMVACRQGQLCPQALLADREAAKATSHGQQRQAAAAGEMSRKAASGSLHPNQAITAGGSLKLIQQQVGDHINSWHMHWCCRSRMKIRVLSPVMSQLPLSELT